MVSTVADRTGVWMGGGEVAGDGGSFTFEGVATRSTGSSSAPSTGAITSNPASRNCAVTILPFISSSERPYSSCQKRTSLGLGKSTPMSAFGKRLAGSSKVGSYSGLRFVSVSGGELK